MRRHLLLAMVAGLFLASAVNAQGQPAGSEQKAAEKKSAGQPHDSIDFDKARALFQRRQKGEKLSADDEAYIRRAMDARQKQNNSGTRPAGGELTPKDKTGLKPLSDMTAEDRYQGEAGGLYGDGKNVPPDAHQRAAEQALAKIQPLDATGKPAANGKIVFVSISMSNATQEFSRFKQKADADADKSRPLTIVDCAQGGQAMAEWVSPQAGPWREADRRIASAGVSHQQVQVAWIKLANKGPQGELNEHGKKLQRDTLAVIQNAKATFPNLQIAYLSSRIYGGYTTGRLNPEPYAYESAFPVRWLIQDQIKGEAAVNFEAAAGPVKAPLLLWGPYLWADGVTPRGGDMLVYLRTDLASDGTHPSESGRDKVAGVMLDFFKTNALAKPWFVGK